jgi:hypothetical protein
LDPASLRSGCDGLLDNYERNLLAALAAMIAREALPPRGWRSGFLFKKYGGWMTPGPDSNSDPTLATILWLSALRREIRK